MTDTTETLTAGKELDARVAFALGRGHWERFKANGLCVFVPTDENERWNWSKGYFTSADYWPDPIERFPDWHNGGHLPAYSTDPGAALTALMTFPDWIMSRGEGYFAVTICADVIEEVRNAANDDFCLAVCGAILNAADAQKASNK